MVPQKLYIMLQKTLSMVQAPFKIATCLEMRLYDMINCILLKLDEVVGPEVDMSDIKCQYVHKSYLYFL